MSMSHAFDYSMTKEAYHELKQRQEKERLERHLALQATAAYRNEQRKIALPRRIWKAIRAYFEMKKREKKEEKFLRNAMAQARKEGFFRNRPCTRCADTLRDLTKRKAA